MKRKPTIRTTLLSLLTVMTTSACQSFSNSESVYKTSHQYKNADGETVTRTIEVKRDPIYDSHPTYDDRWSTPPPAPVAMVPASAEDTSAKPAAKVIQNTAVEETQNSKAGLLGSLELAMTPGHVHLGAHVGVPLSSWWDARLGISMFFSKDTYTGFDLSTRGYVPFDWKIRPYAGLGLYFGDSKQCSRDPIGGGYTVEVCDKKFMSAGYAEAGLELGGFNLFVRDYNITRAGLSVPTETFYGLGITSRF